MIRNYANLLFIILNISFLVARIGLTIVHLVLKSIKFVVQLEKCIYSGIALVRFA